MEKQTAKQPSSQAAKQPSSQAAKQPSSQAAKQPSSQAAKQPPSSLIAVVFSKPSASRLRVLDGQFFIPHHHRCSGGLAAEVGGGLESGSSRRVIDCCWQGDFDRSFRQWRKGLARQAICSNPEATTQHASSRLHIQARRLQTARPDRPCRHHHDRRCRVAGLHATFYQDAHPSPHDFACESACLADDDRSAGLDAAMNLTGCNHHIIHPHALVAGWACENLGSPCDGKWSRAMHAPHRSAMKRREELATG
jgi:hypothetical protein